MWVNKRWLVWGFWVCLFFGLWINSNWIDPIEWFDLTWFGCSDWSTLIFFKSDRFSKQNQMDNGCQIALHRPHNLWYTSCVNYFFPHSVNILQGLWPVSTCNFKEVPLFICSDSSPKIPLNLRVLPSPCASGGAWQRPEKTLTKSREQLLEGGKSRSLFASVSTPWQL